LGRVGTYHLSLTDTSYVDDGDEIQPMNAGADLTIVVGVATGG